MLLAIIWALFNSLGPLLFFVYLFTKGRPMRLAVSAARTTSLVLAAAAIACLWVILPNTYLIPAAMQPVATFLDAQRAAGSLPPAAKAAYPWLSIEDVAVDLASIALPGRGDGGGGSGGLLNVTASGGFYADGATRVKHLLPQAWSVALLAWSVMEFQGGYEQVGGWSLSRLGCNDRVDP